MNDSEKKDRVEAFFKEAFCIDGSARMMAPSEASRLMHDGVVNVVELKDSKRGTFYVAGITAGPLFHKPPEHGPGSTCEVGLPDCIECNNKMF